MGIGAHSRSVGLIAVLVATLLTVPGVLLANPAQAANSSADATKAPTAAKATKAKRKVHVTTATGKRFSKGTTNGPAKVRPLPKSAGIQVGRIVVAPNKRKVTLGDVRWAPVSAIKGDSRYSVRVLTSKQQPRGGAVLRQAGLHQSQSAQASVRVRLSKSAAKRVRHANKVYVAVSQVHDVNGNGSWERFDTHSTPVKVGKPMVLNGSKVQQASNRVSGRGKVTRSSGQPNMVGVDLSAFQCPGSSNPAVSYPLTGNLKGANLQCQNYTASPVQNPNLSQAQLNGADFGGLDFTGVNVSGAQLQTVTLDNGAITTGVAILPVNLTNANLAGANLAGTDFQNVTATSANLVGATVTGANLAYANFTSASMGSLDLSGMDLWGSSFQGADLTSANLSGANLEAQCCTSGFTPHWIAGGANLTDAKLVNANLTGAQLGTVTACVSWGGFCGGWYPDPETYYVTMNGVDLSGATLSAGQLQNQGGDNLQPSANGPTKLQGTNLTPQFVGTSAFSGTTMNNVDFTGANLTGQDFGGTSIEDSILVGANLSGVTLNGIDFTGVEFATEAGDCPTALTGGNLSNSNLTQAHGSYCDFTGTNLNGANFTGATFINATMTSQTTLGNATLTGANFGGLQGTGLDFRFISDFQAAGFNNSNLPQALFQNTDLSGVWLANSQFIGANFTGTSLTNATLGNSNLSNAILTGADLQNAEPTGLSNQAICESTTWFDGSLAPNGPCQP